MKMMYVLRNVNKVGAKRSAMSVRKRSVWMKTVRKLVKIRIYVPNNAILVYCANKK